MDSQQVLQNAQDAMSVRRVFGDPIPAGDVVVIPAAMVAGGGGGGDKGTSEGGAGFGITARPAGVFAIRDGQVKWRPAVNVNRAILGGQIVGVVALTVIGSLVRLWMSERRAA